MQESSDPQVFYDLSSVSSIKLEVKVLAYGESTPAAFEHYAKAVDSHFAPQS